MNKILMIGMSSNLGGIEIFIYNFYCELRKKNVNIDFLVWNDKICFEDEITELGGKVFHLKHLRKKNPYKYFLEIYSFIKIHPEYNIIHINLQSASSIEAVIVAKLFKRKLIVHSHNSDLNASLITRLLHNINKRIIRISASYFLACSVAAGKWMFGSNVIRGKRFLVIPNGINVDLFYYDPIVRRNIRKELSIQEHNYVIGHVGRFADAKNHDFLIECLYDLIKINPLFLLILVGDGKLKEKIFEKAKFLNILDNIRFLGLRKDVNRLYNSMDIFVLPSKYEGLGIVAIEAQYNSLPCLISDNVTHEVAISNNIKFLPLIKDNWVKHIIKCADSENKREFSVNNNIFDIKIAAETLNKVYKEIYLEK